MAMALVILLVVAVLGIRGISKPFLGLLALLVIYVVQPGEIYPVLAPLHLERVLAVVVLASFFFHGNKFKFPPVTKWFLGLYGAMILSIPLAFWVGNSIQHCIQFLEIVTFHLLIVALLDDPKRFRQFTTTWVALIGWLAGTSMFLYMTGVQIHTMGIDRAEGLTSSGGDPNSLGITLVTAMPLEFLLMIKGNGKWTKLLALGVFLISVTTIISTGSRTSFFAFVLFLLLVVFSDRKRLKFLPILVVLAPLVWLIIPQQYKARYETVDNLKNDDSYQNRVLSWEGGIQMFLSNPITGIGPNNYTPANGEKYWPGKPRHWLDAHSLFFKLIAELGLVGVVAFTGYLVTLFRTNARILREWKNRTADIVTRKFGLYCNISLMILLFAGYSGHNLYRNTWYILGALSAAVGVMQPGDNKQKVAAVKPRRMTAAWLPEPVDEPELAPADAK
jgi:putative inorganic carbon (hco3(-)) transporter